MPFPLQHDVENTGFLIAAGDEKLCYITDTGFCRYRFQGLTRIMLEVNHQEEIMSENVTNGTIPYHLKKRIMRNHMSLGRAIDFLKANDLSKVVEIHAIHLSDTNSCPAEIKKALQEVTGKMVFV